MDKKILSVLEEIRDQQKQSIEFTKESVSKQQGMVKNFLVVVAVMVAVFLLGGFLTQT